MLLGRYDDHNIKCCMIFYTHKIIHTMSVSRRTKTSNICNLLVYYSGPAQFCFVLQNTVSPKELLGIYNRILTFAIAWNIVTRQTLYSIEVFAISDRQVNFTKGKNHIGVTSNYDKSFMTKLECFMTE